MRPYARLTLAAFDLGRRLLLGLPSRRARGRGKRNCKRRLELECLEDRTLLSASILGSVWNDLVADGIRAGGEPGIAAVTLFLDSGGTHIQQTLTGGSGAYSFTGLAAGTYSVALDLPTGAGVTFPGGGTLAQQVQVTADQVVDGVDFGLQTAPEVVPNEAVTNDAGVQQMPSVAVDPRPGHANHVVTAYMDYGPQNAVYAGIAVAVSDDGGATWQRSSIPLPADFDQAAGQPIAAFDADGRVYVTFMAATFLGKDSNGSALKPALIYDTATQAVSFLGKTVSRRAFGMQANNGVFVARSDDGGLTWATPVAVASQRYDQTATTSPDAVAAGSTATITPASMPADLFVGKALIVDEGLASMERVTVTAVTGTTFTAKFTKAHAAGFTIRTPVFFEAQPDLAIDAHGNLYVVWTRFYPATQFPGLTGSTSGSDIMIAVSSDGGQTWLTQLQTQGGAQVSTIRDPVVGTASASTEGTGQSTLPRVTVGPEGDVYVSMFAGARFPVFHSTDAGAHFTNPNPSQSNPPAATGYPFGTDFQTDSIYPPGASAPNFVPSGTLFNNSFRTQAVRAIFADPARPGHVYAVEATQVIRVGTTTVIDAGEIHFARSEDYGVTWTRVFTVGSNPSNRDEVAAQFLPRFRSSLNDDDGGRFLAADSTLTDEVISGQALPQLSVDEQGNILVIWYDTRRDPANHSLDVYGTVSTDGGQTFSANYRVTDTTFDANAGKFTDARNLQNFYLGDRIGLAAADGKVYAAWTDTRNGTPTNPNQDIFFASYDLAPAPLPFNDRFESNDTKQTFTDLGRVSAARLLPRLSLTGNDHDWFRVEAGATGNLIVTATAGNALQVELWSADGTTLLASGTPVLSGGQVLGQQISFLSNSGQKYLVHVTGGLVPLYSLALQSLTADLGTSVHATADNSINAGGVALYRIVSAVGGSLEFTLTSGGNVSGNLNLQVLSADGQTVLASGTPSGNPGPGEVEKISLAVGAGQIVLVQVSGTTGSSGNFHLEITNLDLFETPQNASLFFPVGGSPSGIAVADLDGDQKPDLVVSSNGLSDSVSVLRSNGDGTFQSPRQFDVGPGLVSSTVREPAVADFNGDTISDVVVSDHSASGVSVLLGRGDGTFAPERRFDATSKPDPVAVGDFNGDGALDLAVLDRVDGPSRLAILLGRGDGTFKPPQTISIPFDRLSYPVRAGDVNGDRKADLVIFGGDTASFRVLLSNGDGTFTVGGTFGTGGVVFNGHLADVNGDGKLDVLADGANSGSVFVHLGNGDGSFQAPLAFSTGPLKPGDNVTVVGLTVVDFGSAQGSTGVGPADGHLDLVVTTRSRLGGDPPQLLLLPGEVDAQGTFSGFGSARRLSTLQGAGEVVSADFNGDGAKDVAVIDADGVLVIYGKRPTIVPNTTPAAARNLGTVVHLVSQPMAIVPGFREAYFRLTVPQDAAGPADQVLDFAAVFEHVQGAGLNMQVLDAAGRVLAEGERVQVAAGQGQRLTVRVFGKDADSFGSYTLVVAVLPKIVKAESQSALPGGPATSLVLTLQGDWLDPAAAQDAANYTILWLGPDGRPGGGDDQTLSPAAGAGGQSVIYNPTANVGVSSGRTYLTAVRQTVTFLFANALPAGSYEIRVGAAVQAAPFNDAEAGLLARVGGPAGHPVVNGSGFVAADLVVPRMGPFAPGDIEAGTPFLTQLHGDLGALLDSLLTRHGDAPGITAALNKQIVDRLGPGVDPRAFTVAVIWLDPVSLDLADPQGARAVYDLQSNVASNGIARTYMEAGGNIEVLVLAGLSGTFTLSIADVQPTARGGAVVIGGGQVQTVSLTDAMRTGSFTFEFNLPGESGGSAAVAATAAQPAANSPPGPVLVAQTPAGATSGGTPTSPLGGDLLTSQFLTAVILVSVAAQPGLPPAFGEQSGAAGQPAQGSANAASQAALILGGGESDDLPDTPEGRARRLAALNRALEILSGGAALETFGAPVLGLIRAILGALRVSHQAPEPRRAEAPAPPPDLAELPPEVVEALWADGCPLDGAAAGGLPADDIPCELLPTADLIPLVGLTALAVGISRPWWWGEDEGRGARTPANGRRKGARHGTITW